MAVFGQEAEAGQQRRNVQMRERNNNSLVDLKEMQKLQFKLTMLLHSFVQSRHII